MIHIKDFQILPPKADTVLITLVGGGKKIHSEPKKKLLNPIRFRKVTLGQYMSCYCMTNSSKFSSLKQHPFFFWFIILQLAGPTWYSWIFKSNRLKSGVSRATFLYEDSEEDSASGLFRLLAEYVSCSPQKGDF